MKKNNHVEFQLDWSDWFAAMLECLDSNLFCFVLLLFPPRKTTRNKPKDSKLSEASLLCVADQNFVCSTQSFGGENKSTLTNATSQPWNILL